MTAPRDTFWGRRPAAGAGRYHPWLIDHGSLTDRIRSRCTAFRVRLVFQGPRRATRDERFLVGSRARSTVVREVYLYCGRTPVVFAHSVARRRDLRGAWRVLARLGTRPLGAALFADPRVRRYPLRFRKLSAREELYTRACAGLTSRPPALWARRSLFILHNSPILVTEIFLPGILAL
ncbi:MAG: chorismate lyase [Betaproteobacteria bacterium]|nr:chorismate lyase [Betaproteobacteria bacterium]